MIALYQLMELLPNSFEPNFQNRLNELFFFLQKEKQLTEEEAAERFFNSTKRIKYFNELKNKLKTKLTDSVIASSVWANVEYKTVLERNYKSFATYKILLLTGSRKAGIEIAKNLLSDVKKTELHALIYEVATDLQFHYSCMENNPKLAKRYGKIARVQADITRIEAMVREYHSMVGGICNTRESFTPSMIEKLKEAEKNTKALLQLGSSQLNRLIYNIIISRYIVEYDYANIIRYCDEALESFSESHPNYKAFRFAFLQKKISALVALGQLKDADNHKINMMLYHYAQAVRQAAVNPEWLCLMVEAMKGDPDGYGISIADLAGSNPAMAQSVNTALKQSIETHGVFPKEESGMDEWLADPDWDANAYLRSQMVYGTDSYDPVIYFVKTPTSCQTEETPTIVIAEAVNCEDEVAGWKGETAVLLSETTVKASDELIIFVGPGILQHFDDPDQKPYVITDAEGVDLSRVDVDIDVDRHQIKKGYRYERSGKSDVKGWALKFFPIEAETHTLQRWEDFNPRRIDKKDINNSKIFTEDLYAFTMDIDDFNNNRQAFIGTWEDDWYASV